MKQLLKLWGSDEDGAALVEAAMLFPVMFVLFFGMVDLGNGILLSQKVVAGSQMVADLVAREEILSEGELENAIDSGEAALMPYATDSYGVDVVGIRFDSDDGDPEVAWRETRNMDENEEVLDLAEGLGEPGEGVIIVTVQYEYEPRFSGAAFDTFEIDEVAVVRGRKNAFVPYDD